ncbi:MAG: TolC family protein [Planctomycetota bacterium]|jgi:outer membrane protein TolC
MRRVLLLLLVGVPVLAQEAERKEQGGEREKTAAEDREKGAEEAEPPDRVIDFQEAVDLGLAYNLGLKSTRLQALMARFSVREEEAAWDTTLSADAAGGEFLTPSRSDLAGADVVDTDSAHFELGFEKPFRLGPSLGLKWRTDYNFNNSAFASVNPAYDSALDVTLLVPLLRGRGREVNESDLRASRAGEQAARWELLDEAALLVERIADAYWDLVYLQEQVRVLEKSVEVARQVEATERRKLRPDIGRSTRLDVVTAVAETKRREVAVIQGEQERADASDALRRLVLPFTGAADDGVGLKAEAIPAPGTGVPRLQGLIELALTTRPDLKQTDANLRRLYESVVQARNNLRIQLDLRATVGWKGLDSNFPDSAGDLFTGDAPSAEAGVAMSWPLGRRAARAALRRSELDLERARVERNDQVNVIIVEVRQAHRALRTALREIDATTEEVKAATEALTGERKRLERGSSTVLDVARLEENVVDANLRLLQAYANVERARVRVDRTSGALLERYDIDLGPELEPVRGKSGAGID